MEETKHYLLTEYAHGAGCGCKIAPAVLQEILGTSTTSVHFDHLLVGHTTNDDAAVVDLGNGTALIATADFFMPIVDDAYDFGRVAAANAISDVYAMGGRPLLALALLGWPVDKLPSALAARVMEGARSICAEAGIPLAGGHSIDTTEPLFGLSVNGLIGTSQIKRNATAKAGDYIYLTKGIGTGILSTAGKRKLLKVEDQEQLVQQLVRLNSFGTVLGRMKEVSAVTDVTGFGLLGHLSEICKGSGLSAELQFSALPLLQGLDTYIQLNVMPDATFRNWNAYNKDLFVHAQVDPSRAFMILPDPQTNGGLLFTASADAVGAIEREMQQAGLGAFAQPIGRMTLKAEKLISVLP
jgi:selenide, water dikinase